MPGRGELIDEIQAKATEFLGRPITVTELRLMPYTSYVMMNERRIDPIKVSADEREILSLWRSEGHIEGGAGGLAITKEFWDIIHELTFLAYVAYDN